MPKWCLNAGEVIDVIVGRGICDDYYEFVKFCVLFAWFSGNQ